jgi:hypothetical protein
VDVKANVRRAIEICSLPHAKFEARMASGEFRRADVAAARALRADLAKRGSETVRIRKSETPKEAQAMSTLVEKVEDGRRQGANLAKAIEAMPRRTPSASRWLPTA